MHIEILLEIIQVVNLTGCKGICDICGKCSFLAAQVFLYLQFELIFALHSAQDVKLANSWLALKFLRGHLLRPRKVLHNQIHYSWIHLIRIILFYSSLNKST